MHCDETRGAGHRIAGFARLAEASSITLLDAIDGTIEALAGLASIMSGFDQMLSSIADDIKAMPIKTGHYLDPDDEAIDALAQAAAGLKNYLTKLVRKRAEIDRDSRLRDDHCEALHEAYENASGVIADLIGSVESLRASIITRDLAAEPRDGEAFESAVALIENLRNK